MRIIDNSNEENVTELAVQVIGDKGVKQIPVYTQCGVTDINEFISETMPDSPEVLYSEVLDMFITIFSPDGPTTMRCLHYMEIYFLTCFL